MCKEDQDRWKTGKKTFNEAIPNLDLIPLLSVSI